MSAPDSLPLPPVQTGTFYAFRLFEVAEDVDLGALGRLELPASVTIRPGRLTFMGRLRSLFSVASLGSRDVEIEPGRWAQADCTILVFSFGVAAACFQFGIGSRASAPKMVDEMSAADCARTVALLNTSDELTRAGREAVDRLLASIAPCLVRPIEYAEFETYVLLSIQAFARDATIDDVLRSADLTRILLGESPTFSPSPPLLAQMASHHYRYGADDLCVIDWDAAITIDPKPNEDIPGLVALALTQLLEFQRYDAILERELNTLYESTLERRSVLRWLGVGGASRRVDQVNRLLLDIGDFVDRSHNAFKITEDVYYARIYRGAIERFGVPAWRSSVLARQQAVAEVARTSYDRAQLGVAHSLEIIIILLITWEVIYAFFD
jgi:hypothetical protein